VGVVLLVDVEGIGAWLLVPPGQNIRFALHDVSVDVLAVYASRSYPLMRGVPRG
jgi:hypothetical protein